MTAIPPPAGASPAGSRPTVWCMPFSQLSEVEVLLHLLPVVPGLTAALATGVNLLQPGCGHGAVLSGLAARFPRSRFAGLCDFPSEATIALRAARITGRQNLWFRHRAQPEPAYGPIFDAVLLLAFNPLAADSRGFVQIARYLKPGGVLLMHLRQPDAEGLAKLGELVAAAGLDVALPVPLLIAPGDLACAARVPLVR